LRPFERTRALFLFFLLTLSYYRPASMHTNREKEIQWEAELAKELESYRQSMATPGQGGAAAAAAAAAAGAAAPSGAALGR
jgi:hypothetical protein